MGDVSTQVQQAALRFANEVTQLVVAQVKEDLLARLSNGANGARVNGSGPRRVVDVPEVVKALPKRKRGSKKKVGVEVDRVRRSPEQLEAVKVKILEHVFENPGARMEKLSAAVGLPTLKLTRPIAALLGEKRLQKEGEKRATEYRVTAKGAKSIKAV